MGIWRYLNSRSTKFYQFAWYLTSLTTILRYVTPGTVFDRYLFDLPIFYHGFAVFSPDRLKKWPWRFLNQYYNKLILNQFKNMYPWVSIIESGYKDTSSSRNNNQPNFSLTEMRQLKFLSREFQKLEAKMNHRNIKTRNLNSNSYLRKNLPN